jgi:hypothetical protein
MEAEFFVGRAERRAGLEASLVAVLFRLGQYEETERAGVRLLAGDLAAAYALFGTMPWPSSIRLQRKLSRPTCGKWFTECSR